MEKRDKNIKAEIYIKKTKLQHRRNTRQQDTRTRKNIRNAHVAHRTEDSRALAPFLLLPPPLPLPLDPLPNSQQGPPDATHRRTNKALMALTAPGNCLRKLIGPNEA